MRWSQSIRLPGGARVNVSKNSIGISTGVGPIRIGANTNGRRFASAKIPGVPGSRVTASAGGKHKNKQGLRPIRAAMSRLLAPTSEAEFVNGLIALYNVGPDKARPHFEKAGTPRHLSPSFYAAFCGATTGYRSSAIARLVEVVNSPRPLPDRLLLRYVNAPTVPIQITPAVTLELPVDKTAAALLAAELYQQRNDLAKAVAILEPLAHTSPAVTLSLAELYNDMQRWDDIVRVTDESRGADDVGAQALVLRAHAFAARDEHDAALASLKEALRAQARRSVKLVLAARYERGLVYQAIGEDKKARAEFAAVVALDEDFADVRARLTAPVVAASVEQPSTAWKVREARRRAGLSQRELAARAGVTKGTISQIEVGMIRPRTETLQKIMQAASSVTPT
jgi:DNA-binding XRE family transcriptional regulator